MSKEVTLQTIDKDLKRELRINNFVGLMNNNQLVNANRNIIGSTMLLSKQVGALSNSFSKAIEEQTSVLDNELSKIGFVLTGIESNIVTVGEILKRQNSILKTTLEKLDEIHDTLKHPLEVESKEQFERGIQWMEKGFLAEAVEAFKVSIEKNPTNYLSHFYLGVLYLCGKDEDDDVIDFKQSEKELKLAIKYSRPDGDNELVKQYIIAIHQHLSDLYYAIALTGENEKENYELAYKELQSALKIDNSEQMQTSLASRLIKCANKNGNPDKVLEYAGVGFLNDNSLLSLLCDNELAEYHERFIEIIDECRLLIKDRINMILTEESGNLEALSKVIDITKDSDCNSYISLSTIQSVLVSAGSAPIAVAAGPASPEEEADELTDFDVILKSFDASKKIAAIKAVREVRADLGLAEAKELVEFGGKVKEGITKADAQAAKEKLEAAGCVVTVIRENDRT